MDAEVRWIETEELADDDNNDGEDDEPDLGTLFADPDPFDTFDFCFGTTTARPIKIRGHKMENGQTLHSTGLTLWRASPLLCEYMVSQQHVLVHQKTVLEVGEYVICVWILSKTLDCVLLIPPPLFQTHCTVYSWEQAWDCVGFLLTIWEPVVSF
jgi:hypothetical protein